ncbi:MAG TPA: hypothetical protein VNX21_00845 [Candidatus Thermoplasmatota archaeon]|nr:hypothetical protein [Candidatus Thermoplasmatota archaeon]
MPGSAEADAGVFSPGVGAVVVNDSETGDCSGSPGVPGDFDGDLDVGVGGGAFGHGPWATHCGFHQEAAGTVTVNDGVFGPTVSFVTGSGDTNSWVADPTTGANTCVTDGVISPGTDPEGDDCLSASGTGAQTVVCPGGGDGLLWVFLAGVSCTANLVSVSPGPYLRVNTTTTPPTVTLNPPTVTPSNPPQVGCTNPGVVGTITSP